MCRGPQVQVVVGEILAESTYALAPGETGGGFAMVLRGEHFRDRLNFSCFELYFE